MALSMEQKMKLAQKRADKVETVPGPASQAMALDNDQKPSVSKSERMSACSVVAFIFAIFAVGIELYLTVRTIHMVCFVPYTEHALNAMYASFAEYDTFLGVFDLTVSEILMSLLNAPNVVSILVISVIAIMVCIASAVFGIIGQRRHNKNIISVLFSKVSYIMSTITIVIVAMMMCVCVVLRKTDVGIFTEVHKRYYDTGASVVMDMPTYDMNTLWEEYMSSDHNEGDASGNSGNSR